MRLERDVGVDERAMDGRELRPCQLARAEQAIALRDGVEIAARAHVGEQRRDVGLGLALRLVGVTAALGADSIGGEARRLLALLGERDVEQRHEDHVAAEQLLLALATVVAVELPRLVHVAEIALRELRHGLALGGDVRDDRRHLDLLTRRRLHPRHAAVGARERLGALRVTEVDARELGPRLVLLDAMVRRRGDLERLPGDDGAAAVRVERVGADQRGLEARRAVELDRHLRERLALRDDVREGRRVARDESQRQREHEPRGPRYELLHRASFPASSVVPTDIVTSSVTISSGRHGDLALHRRCVGMGQRDPVLSRRERDRAREGRGLHLLPVDPHVGPRRREHAQAAALARYQLERAVARLHAAARG